MGIACHGVLLGTVSKICSLFFIAYVYAELTHVLPYFLPSLQTRALDFGVIAPSLWRLCLQVNILQKLGSSG